MDSIQLTKKAIKVLFDDKEYIVKKPSARQINDFSKAKDVSIDATIAFLEMLGLPQEISWEIDADSLTEICRALMPALSEKKS
jgi:hypothetical protein